MKKTYLLSYECQQFQALNTGGITYELRFEVVWFGLFSRPQRGPYLIPHSESSGYYRQVWDALINQKIPVTSKVTWECPLPK